MPRGGVTRSTAQSPFSSVVGAPAPNAVGTMHPGGTPVETKSPKAKTVQPYSIAGGGKPQTGAPMGVGSALINALDAFGYAKSGQKVPKPLDRFVFGDGATKYLKDKKPSVYATWGPKGKKKAGKA